MPRKQLRPMSLSVLGDGGNGGARVVDDNDRFGLFYDPAAAAQRGR